jgi:hypothetical protein
VAVVAGKAVGVAGRSLALVVANRRLAHVSL